MPTHLNGLAIKSMTDPTMPVLVPAVVPGPARQRFNTEIAFYRSCAEVDDCLATPVGGRRVLLFGGQGPLTPPRVGLPKPALWLLAAEPLEAAVLAHAALRDGDTLTVLLPSGWSEPPVEVLLEHARRWFSSTNKHS